MKIFAAGLATESNTFAPFPTGELAFEEAGIYRGDASSGGSVLSSMLKTWRDAAEAGGHEFIEGFVSYAQPAGTTVQRVYEKYRDEILGDIAQRGPFDIVLLGLHGAMVADGYEDCEGDLISRIREASAATTVIGAELDPHAHLTRQMVEKADVIIAAKEYPHIDFPDRAAELFDLCLRTRLGEIRPTSAVYDCRMTGWYPTTVEPMKGLVARSRELESEPGMLSVSIIHGFPWADVREMGTKVLVVTDRDPQLGARTAADLGGAIYAQREALRPRFAKLEEALDAAQRLPGRVVIADVADNAGGGAPADNTAMLRSMLRRGITDAACGLFWDPIAARICADAGVGATLPLRLGGKCGPMSSDPLDVMATIRAVDPDHAQTRFSGGLSLGLSVWIQVQGIDVVIISKRNQTLSPSGFTGLGIDLEGKRLIAVKSSQHFHAAFSKIADEIVYAATSGTLEMDFANIPYTKRDPNFYPRVADPLGQGVATV